MTDTNPSWMEKVEKMAEEVAAREGCFLYDIEFVGAGKHRTLRVYIDKTPAANEQNPEDSLGVGIEDCSNVSRGLNEILDKEDVIPGSAYDLEVSTPGIDRKLRKPWHFEKVVGKKIWVKTQKPFESFGNLEKKWKAAKQIDEILQSFDGAQLVFTTKEGDVKIPLEAVEKASLVFEMNKGKKK